MSSPAFDYISLGHFREKTVDRITAPRAHTISPTAPEFKVNLPLPFGIEREREARKFSLFLSAFGVLCLGGGWETGTPIGPRTISTTGNSLFFVSS